jgi:hypothetical protein
MWSAPFAIPECTYPRVTALADGRALALCRGEDGTSAARLFDDVTDSWGATSSLPAPLYGFDLESLPSGEVLVVGTSSSSYGDRLAFLYTPELGSVGFGRTSPPANAHTSG